MVVCPMIITQAD